MSLIEESGGVLDTSDVVEVMIIDADHSVSHCNATLSSRGAAGTDSADVDARVKSDAVVSSVAQVQHCLVSLPSSASPHQETDGAGGAPQCGHHRGLVHVTTVNVVHSQNTIIHLEFTLRNTAFGD